MFEPPAAQDVAQRAPRTKGTRRLHEHHRGGAEEAVLEIGARAGPVRCRSLGFERRQHGFHVPLPGTRRLQEPDGLLDGLRRRRRVAGRVTVSHQESAVARDAVADLAEAGEIDEEPLLEERRNRIVEIGGLGEIPKPFDQLRRIRRRHEEVGHQAKAAGDFTMEGRGGSGRGSGGGRNRNRRSKDRRIHGHSSRSCDLADLRQGCSRPQAASVDAPARL